MIFLNDAINESFDMSDRIRENYKFLLMLLNMMCLVHQVAVIVKQNKGLGMPVIRVFAIAIPKMAAVYLS